MSGSDIVLICYYRQLTIHSSVYIMASSTAVPPNPGAKGPRMCRAVVDLGGDILRDALYYHIKPAVVVSYVLASRYFRNQPLNVHQISVLQNTSVKGDYSDCDITLIYSLLRNLPSTSAALRPTSGWGKLPVAAGDTTLGDDIERIRQIRNEVYGHVASTAISDALYTHYMAELQAICVRMDTTNIGCLMSPAPRTQTYVQTLADIQVMCMDPDTEARYTDDIRRMREADIQSREMIDEVRGEISGNVTFLKISFYRKPHKIF